MPVKSSWKAHERKTASAFGTKRVPMSGAIKSLNTHSDSFHDKIYFEAKYRSNAMLKIVYDFFDEACDMASVNIRSPKAVTKAPLLTIRQEGKRGNLMCFHINHFSQIVSASFVKNHLQRKKLSLWTLWEDTVTKAAVEEKIPVLAIKKAGRPGFLLVLKPENLKTVFDLYGKSGQHVSKS